MAKSAWLHAPAHHKQRPRLWLLWSRLESRGAVCMPCDASTAVQLTLERILCTSYGHGIPFLQVLACQAAC